MKRVARVLRLGREQAQDRERARLLPGAGEDGERTDAYRDEVLSRLAEIERRLEAKK